MKWYIYLICLALVIAGAFCGVRLYTLVTAESYVNGSIDIKNEFTMESFSYANTTVEFYHDIYDDSDVYSYSNDLKPVTDFDGEKKTYRVTLNNYVILNAQISAGSVFARVYMDFYDTNGNIVCSSLLDISVKFLSNKTTLELYTVGGENASFLTRYFRDNGIRLKITEIEPTQILEEVTKND